MGGFLRGQTGAKRVADGKYVTQHANGCKQQMTNASMTPGTHQALLEELKARLDAVHGARLRGVVLFGSEARGEATEQSDIDLLVLLDGPIDLARDLEQNLMAVYPVALRLGRRISAKPVAIDAYRNDDCPLFRAARRDGIAA